MVSIPDEDRPYWIESTEDANYPVLNNDIDTDVAIIGGGIAGLTTGYLLKQSGMRVVVLEKSTIGSAVSGRTTGKVTSQHNLIYKKLRDQFGQKAAAIYGEANERAISLIEEIINKHEIVCDWAVDDNYLFSEDTKDVPKLKEEAKAAAAAGLPASFEKDTPLPFKTKGAVKFQNQAKLHIRKYLLGLAGIINGDGSFVYEHSGARWIRGGQPCLVRTSSARIHAKYVIIATNVPFPWTAHGFYCFYEYPLKSYVIAAKAKVRLRGMYITPGKPLYSILPIRSGKDSYLLIGGNSHLPVTTGSADKRYQKLAEYGQLKFGIENYEYRWSTMDYLCYDNMPMAGPLYPWSKHVFTATGFMKWGLSSATVSALILRDLIVGDANAWSDLLRTNRVSAVKAIPHVIAQYVRPS